VGSKRLIGFPAGKVPRAPPWGAFVAPAPPPGLGHALNLCGRWSEVIHNKLGSGGAVPQSQSHSRRSLGPQSVVVAASRTGGAGRKQALRLASVLPARLAVEGIAVDAEALGTQPLGPQVAIGLNHRLTHPKAGCRGSARTIRSRHRPR